MVKRGLVKDKSGQFYLIAAIIISVIVIGFVGMSNYSRRPETASVQTAGEELSMESEKVLDYATFRGPDENENRAMKDFATKYITYLREGKDSYFIFGNSALITFVGYSNSDKTIYVDGGAGQTPINLNERQISSQDFSSPSDEVILTIDGEDYEFELK